MADDPIIISEDDLGSKKVEKRLAEQQALARNREQAAMSLEQAEKIQADSPRPSIWYNAWFALTFFGLLGGLLAWGSSEGVLRLRPIDEKRSEELVQSIRDIRKAFDRGQITAVQQSQAIVDIEAAGAGNDYLALEMDNHLTDAERQARRSDLHQRDERKEFILNTISYGMCGMLIALCLAIAEPVVDRNIPRAIMMGTVGMTLGLAGGVAASFFINELYHRILGEDPTANMQLLARMATWGLMGLIISIAPGLVMANRRRLLIGMVGGAIGGLIGGAMWDIVASTLDNPLVGRLTALCAIGALAGLFTGVIEAAAKTGWIRVTQGLIAGKQFVIYRNPTYVGAGPECQIYLFKDPKIGRRHAAIHIVNGGFEIEDLPLGEQTFVNGQPIVRHRLAHGDRISVGSSQLLFQEKVKGA